MSDLVEWLTKILDEDEKPAREEKELADEVYDRPAFTVDYQWARMTKHTSGGWGSSFAPGAPSPDAVLADIAAKRAVIAIHTGFHECPSQEDNCGWVTDDRCSTLLLLATAYADRPGYHFNGWQT